MSISFNGFDRVSNAVAMSNIREFKKILALPEDLCKKAFEGFKPPAGLPEELASMEAIKFLLEYSTINSETDINSAASVEETGDSFFHPAGQNELQLLINHSLLIQRGLWNRVDELIDQSDEMTLTGLIDTGGPIEQQPLWDLIEIGQWELVEKIIDKANVKCLERLLTIPAKDGGILIASIIYKKAYQLVDKILTRCDKSLLNCYSMFECHSNLNVLCLLAIHDQFELIEKYLPYCKDEYLFASPSSGTQDEVNFISLIAKKNQWMLLRKVVTQVDNDNLCRPITLDKNCRAKSNIFNVLAASRQWGPFLNAIKRVEGPCIICSPRFVNESNPLSMAIIDCQWELVDLMIDKCDPSAYLIRSKDFRPGMKDISTPFSSLVSLKKWDLVIKMMRNCDGSLLNKLLVSSDQLGSNLILDAAYARRWDLIEQVLKKDELGDISELILDYKAKEQNAFRLMISEKRWALLENTIKHFSPAVKQTLNYTDFFETAISHLKEESDKEVFIKFLSLLKLKTCPPAVISCALEQADSSEAKGAEFRGYLLHVPLKKSGFAPSHVKLLVDEALAKGQYDKAEKILQETLNKDKENVWAREKLAELNRASAPVELRPAPQSYRQTTTALITPASVQDCAPTDDPIQKKLLDKIKKKNDAEGAKLALDRHKKDFSTDQTDILNFGNWKKDLVNFMEQEEKKAARSKTPVSSQVTDKKISSVSSPISTGVASSSPSRVVQAIPAKPKLKAEAQEFKPRLNGLAAAAGLNTAASTFVPRSTFTPDSLSRGFATRAAAAAAPLRASGALTALTLSSYVSAIDTPQQTRLKAARSLFVDCEDAINSKAPDEAKKRTLYYKLFMLLEQLRWVEGFEGLSALRHDLRHFHEKYTLDDLRDYVILLRDRKLTEVIDILMTNKVRTAPFMAPAPLKKETANSVPELIGLIKEETSHFATWQDKLGHDSRGLLQNDATHAIVLACYLRIGSLLLRLKNDHHINFNNKQLHLVIKTAGKIAHDEQEDEVAQLVFNDPVNSTAAYDFLINAKRWLAEFV